MAVHIDPVAEAVDAYVGSVSRLTNAGKVRYTYDDDDRANPHISGQRPDTIAEIHLSDERNDCAHEAEVYCGVMHSAEALEVAKSLNEPIVDICTGQRCLGGLQR